MIEETIPDTERQILLRLAMTAVAERPDDLELANVAAKICGADTVLVTRRAYPAPEVRSMRVPGSGS